jgi:hypothetical protein
VSTHDLPQDIGQRDAFDGNEVLADMLVYGGHGRRAMSRVVVAEAEGAGGVLIVIGAGGALDGVVADPHVFSNVQLRSVREGEHTRWLPAARDPA